MVILDPEVLKKDEKRIKYQNPPLHEPGTPSLRVVTVAGTHRASSASTRRRTRGLLPTPRGARGEGGRDDHRARRRNQERNMGPSGPGGVVRDTHAARRRPCRHTAPSPTEASGPLRSPCTRGN